MAILALPDTVTSWQELLRHERETGEIPLPAVDSVVFGDVGDPVVSLIAPDLVSDSSSVFVDLARMPSADRVTLDFLLALLRHESGLPTEQVAAIYHSGGLAYELSGPSHQSAVQWGDLPEATRPVIWSILHAVAKLGAQYPDWETSSPRVVVEAKGGDQITQTRAELERLAGLLRSRGAVDGEIAAMVGRPAQLGHLGEYIAARVFGIELHMSASARGHDGFFTSGALAGRSVNIKWYASHQRLLDLHPEPNADYYLVLTAPFTAAVSSRGATRPWTIAAAYLFEVGKLYVDMRTRGARIGVASSVLAGHWEAAEIFPMPRNPALVLTQQQRELLTLFAPIAPRVS